MRFATLCLSLMTVAIVTGHAQNSRTIPPPPPEKIDWSDSSDIFDMESPSWTNLSKAKPTFTLWGGTTAMRRDGIASIEGNTSFGLDLGTTYRRDLAEKTQSSSFDGVYVWYAMAKDQPQPPVSHTADVWRFGFSSDKGYGYQLGETMAVNFYAGSSVLSWNVVNTKGLTADSLQNLALQEFDGSVRFGGSSQAGIGLQVSKGVELRGSYDWTQVYPRHLFWFWAGSGVIEGVSDGIARAFVDAIGKSSPAAKPIMHFVLRNAVAMGFKGLRQHQMNWPFDTVAPLNMQTWRVSIVVTF